MGIFKKNEKKERGELQKQKYQYQIIFEFKDGTEPLINEFSSSNSNLDKNVALRENFNIQRTTIEVEYLGVVLPIDLRDVSNFTLKRLDRDVAEMDSFSSVDDPEPSLFGFQALEARKLVGINQKDFAKMVGISVKKLSAYEREIEVIPHDIAVKINNCLQAVEMDQEEVSAVEISDDAEQHENVEHDEMYQRFIEQEAEPLEEVPTLNNEESKKSLLPFKKKKESEDFYKKEKKRKPKTSNRKVVKTAFWGGFVALLGFGAFGVFGMNNTTAELNHAKKSIVSLEVQAKENQGIPYKNMDAGKQFAREFFANYYTWSLEDNGIENHSERLSDYLNKNLDKNGGLIFDNESMGSKALNVDISEVNVKRENVMDVTARIEVQPYSADDEKEETEEIQVKNALEEKESDSKIETKESEKEEITVKGGSESTESFFVYLKVEVRSFDDGFEITSLPTIQSAPKKSSENKSSFINQTNYGENVNDEKVNKKMNEFLGTFFKTFATGTENELQYYVQMKNFEPLKTSYEFSSISEVAIFKKDKKYIVPVTVEFKDKVTKSKLQTKYLLTIVEKDDQLFITDFKDGEV